MHNVVISSSATLDRMFFSFNGRSYERTSHMAGRPEMYELDDSTGIYMFLGYDTLAACEHAARQCGSTLSPETITALRDDLYVDILAAWAKAFD